MQNIFKRFVQSKSDSTFSFEGGFGILCILGGFGFVFCTINTCISNFKNHTFWGFVFFLILVCFNFFISFINIYYRMKYSLSLALALSFISGVLIADSIYITLLFVILTGFSMFTVRLKNLIRNQKK